MDRFIATDTNSLEHIRAILKSNMDRFIVKKSLDCFSEFFILKSNMDRFIVLQTEVVYRVSQF